MRRDMSARSPLGGLRESTVTSKSSPACLTAFLMVFHHESESGAWLISTYRPAAFAAPALSASTAATARVFRIERLLSEFMDRVSFVVSRLAHRAAAPGLRGQDVTHSGR